MKQTESVLALPVEITKYNDLFLLPLASIFLNVLY